MNGTEPGVLAFSGTTNNTASRTTALVVSPDCGSAAKKNDDVCRVWIGAAGGGVWTTENALAANPSWEQLRADKLDQNSVGTLTLDPTDGKNATLYLGTGEANRCSSGCEAGVGIYRSDNGGKSWEHLESRCVDNATYACVNPGQDAFLGRGIRAVVIDPDNSQHIFVGSAQAVRGLSHTIGNGGTTRLEPGANEAGLYESTDGGETFTEIWDGNARGGAQPPPAPWGINDVELDPLNSNTVYASAFDAGLWRRDAGAAQTAFSQLFAPQFVPPQCGSPPQTPPTCAFGGTDRTMFALTVKNGHTRVYLTEGTANPGASTGPFAANFWRTDNANQPAATLLASQAAGITVPAGNGNPFPATYNTWQKLSSSSTASPYYPTIDFCTGQCWYDQNVYTPAGLPDTVYVVGSYTYGEIPCNTKGVGCGSGRSNGRAVIYSTTAGDPDATATGGAVNRTFTDLTFDAQNDPSATWCALGAAQAPVAEPFRCLWAPNSIHPDEHVIAVNPSNPTQIFQGSDGAMIRTSGTFSDISFRCNSNERPTLGAASLANCARLLSRVPTKIDHIDTNYSSTLQFINVAINPLSTCEVMGGTQDNGTWSNINNCDTNTFWQVIYGDGGNAGYDKTTAWRFNEFTSGASDSNFKNGNPEKWVITSAPVVRSGEGAAFYWPLIADPNPVSFGGQVTHPTYSGAKHVWRSWAFGAGVPGHVPQDTTPDIAGYESTCQEFTVSSTSPACGDNRPLGGPYCEGAAACVNAPGDLTGTVYGADRAGGSISFLARTSSDHGTLWAATGAGRLFVTHNADAADPATVTWHRIDNASSPTRFPSGISVDPADAGHAWVSYSGYNAITPTTPGHVFDVHENGVAPNSGVFVNLNVEQGTGKFPTPFGDGDLPVSDVVRDDASGTLFASTDFGVLRGDDDGKSWHVTKGMPRYEVMHLEMQPSSRVATCALGSPGCNRVLYAATHSQGIWRMEFK